MTTQSEMRDMAEKAATAAVRNTLLTMGIDVDEPIVSQGDFMVLREVGKLVKDADFRKDLEHLRKWRLSMERVGAKSVGVAVTVIVTGLLGALWAGIQLYLHLPHTGA